LLDSKALTKIQSIILVAVIVVAAFGGGIGYILLSEEEKSSDTIKIGVLTDLGTINGRNMWQGVVLAAEQLNNEGGILEKQIEYVGEDTDSYTSGDATKINLALTRLLTFHNVDFIIGGSGSEGFMVQESIAEHKRISFEIGANEDEYTQRVLDEYDKYKYFFRPLFNATSISLGVLDGLLHLRELTGFNKIGYLREDLGWTEGFVQGFDYVLAEVYGFELVYDGKFPLDTVDYSSYFAAAEAEEVEILIPLIVGSKTIPFVKEYHDRQSPMVIYGGFIDSIAAGPEGWVNTDGKCEYISAVLYPTEVGYPLTSKTLPAREAYIDRWDEIPNWAATWAYDTLRYILADAIKRAGTLDTDAVIQALETTSIELSNARNFVFTESHNLMMGKNPNDPEAEYTFVIYFQWQNGQLVPVYPKKIMEEAGSTYMFPDWHGPWDDIS
jgi:branched-chain amino acid transport system substrate-binding protein